MRTCAVLKTVRRLILYLPLLVTLVPFIPGEALAKGGTNLHEPLPVFHAVGRTVGSWTRSFLPDEIFEGCGHGRYRVLSTHKCRGPANFGD